MDQSVRIVIKLNDVTNKPKNDSDVTSKIIKVKSSNGRGKFGVRRNRRWEKIVTVETKYLRYKRTWTGFRVTST